MTQLHYGTTTPVGPETATFDATDYSVMQFLFQETKKEVKLQISHVNVSPAFCTAIFTVSVSLTTLSRPATGTTNALVMIIPLVEGWDC